MVALPTLEPGPLDKRTLRFRIKSPKESVLNYQFHRELHPDCIDVYPNGSFDPFVVHDHNTTPLFGFKATYDFIGNYSVISKYLDASDSEKMALAHNNGTYDFGSEFATTRYWQSHDGTYSGTWRVGCSAYRASGEWQVGNNNEPDEATPSTRSELNALATKLLASSLPTRDDFDSGVSIGEAPEVLSLLTLRKAYDIRSGLAVLASGVLLTNLGLRPLLRDAENLVGLTDRLTKAVNFLIRNNGKFIRRKFSLPPSTVVTTGSISGSLPSLDARAFNSLDAPPVSWTKTVRIERSLSAAFIYHWTLPQTPKGDSEAKGLEERLVGLRLTPSTLYELFPFSFLLDYISNVGAVLRLAESKHDNRYPIHLAYAYILERRHVSIRYQTPSADIVDGESIGDSTHNWETKVRIRVDPQSIDFVNLADISLSQASNVVALAAVFAAGRTVRSLTRLLVISHRFLARL